MTRSRILRVLAITQEFDPHWDTVAPYLSHVPSDRTSLESWRQHVVEWDTHSGLVLTLNTGSYVINDRTTVWWRRPGHFEGATLSDAERELAHDESSVMLPGALDAVGVRWVDDPWRMTWAGNRLVQLNVADSAGARVPRTLVTNSPRAAERLLATGPVVAKTISTGPGLAPYVDIVDAGSVDLVSAAPVLLQAAIRAEFDLRLVAVGDECFAWRRPRTDPVLLDWRAEDPAGDGFEPTTVSDRLRKVAVQIQEQLGLSFGVQDWLRTDSEDWFLEVNPQGQWVFLDGASESVGAAMARHLEGLG